MLNYPDFSPVDYLLIGHLTQDITPHGPSLGGTVAYAALTARALGQRVGVVTSWGEELPLAALKGVVVANAPCEHSTTFENITRPEGRTQIIHHVADELDYHLVPEVWRGAPLVHLAPVAQEVLPTLVRHFEGALLCATLQGWLREWDADGRVRVGEWPEARFVLQQVDAAVLSMEDVDGDLGRIDELAAVCPILAVTDAANGAYLHLGGEHYHLPAPTVEMADSVGAGDIFAAAFFSRLRIGDDPIEAARFANQVAAHSVTRQGLRGVPEPHEIYDLTAEMG